MSDFDRFVTGPIAEGDVAEALRMSIREYASARRSGWTALHWASWYTDGDREGVVRMLLDRGCDIEAETDESAGIPFAIGWRPIHVCAYKDNRGVLRTLLETGCFFTALNGEGETPLDVAERHNHIECASMLRAAAQSKGHLEVTKVSVDSAQKGASGGRVLNSETGTTLLEKLLDGKDPKVLKAIKAKKVDTREINAWKSLKILRVYPQSYQLKHECLMYRCIQQNYDREVYSLCTADIVNRTSLFMGPTALETAVRFEAVVWVHEILNKLVNVDKSWSKAEDIAMKKNLLDIHEMITKRRDYLNRKYKKGLSRLHIAVIENDPDMVEYLTKNGQDTGNDSHINLGTALSLAYNIDNIDCMQSLQANNVNVNTVDTTPLQVAIVNKTEDLCEYLVNNKIITCNICEDKPRDCALNCGHVLCMTCAEKTIDCYVCRGRITDRRRIFI